MSNQFRIIGFMAAIGVLMAACSGSAPINRGLSADGRLAPCPDKPNCVSSLAPADDKRHFIAPIAADEAAWQRLPGILADMPGFRIIRQEDLYLQAEATTRIWRFVDDVAFLYDPGQSLIHVRSASRVGYSDLGANRRRIEAIRARLGG